METLVQNIWSKSKLLIKALVIGFIILILQIPSFYVTELIEEREKRQLDAIDEVSSKWAGKQTILGAVLVLPFWENNTDTSKKSIRLKQHAYFLPGELKINATVQPIEKHRGIYKVMLYSSAINLSGKFNSIQIERMNILPQDVIWNEAMIKLPLSDNKGLNEELTMRVNDSLITLSPQSAADGAISSALEGKLALTGPQDLENINFSAAFNLNGSQQLLFTPSGGATTVNVKAAWPHPNFTGDILPQTSAIDKNGFTASWKTIAGKNNFPQQWVGRDYTIAPNDFNTTVRQSTVEANPKNINAAAFGVSLFVPVNGYQKTMRSIKYAALCMLLTFAAFFIIETSNRKSVHPFQYGLVGLALVLFYTLLLSFSEYIGFNFAYAIAAFLTIGLIGWFVKGLLASNRLATFLSTILMLLYGYVFTILQLQDYSLLLGSLGLFLTLGVIMYFSKKIQW